MRRPPQWRGTSASSRAMPRPNKGSRPRLQPSGLHPTPAQDFPKVHPREAFMTPLRILAAGLAAAFALATATAHAEMKKEWVEYGHGDTRLKAYMAYDDQGAGKRPAVLMVHAREGMTPKTLSLAENWAKL